MGGFYYEPVRLIRKRKEEMSTSRMFSLIAALLFLAVFMYFLAGELLILCYIKEHCNFIPGWAMPVAKFLKFAITSRP